jgi:hypothetical protein
VLNFFTQSANLLVQNISAVAMSLDFSLSGGEGDLICAPWSRPKVSAGEEAERCTHQS